VINYNKERVVQIANSLGDVRIATSASSRSGVVGIGITIYNTPSTKGAPSVTLSTTLGAQTEQNLYTAELAAIAKAISCVLLSLPRGQIVIVSSNQAVLKAISKPHHQSGQSDLCQIYKMIRLLGTRNHYVLIL
jgi:hypothetical protein